MPPGPKLEQDRRDFKRDNPKLYEYIALRESAKTLDSAGDQISGHHEAANKVWSESSRLNLKWRRMLDE